MAFVNIGGSDDPAYRYKMPRITVKIEGKGNGIKTVITNMSAVASALRRDPTLPTKYFGIELGAQSKYVAETDKATVNGPHDAASLQTLLNGFVSKFVLCPKCSLPETDLIIKPKSGTIVHKCAACGNKGPVDMMHKLVTFILKENTKAPSGKVKKGDKKEGGKKKKKDADSESEPDAGEESVAAPAAAPAAAGGAGGDPAGAESAGESSEDEENTGEVVATSSAVVVDDSSAMEAAVEALKAFLAKTKEPLAVSQQVRQLQTNSALPLEDRVRLYYLAAFDKSLMAQSGDAVVLSPLATLIAGMESDPRKLQQFKHTLLDCFEEHVGTRLPALLPVTPVVLKNLYDNDILDEDVIVEWFNKPQAAGSAGELVRARASPFVTWLKDAEEEDGEEAGAE